MFFWSLVVTILTDNWGLKLPSFLDLRSFWRKIDHSDLLHMITLIRYTFTACPATFEKLWGADFGLTPGANWATQGCFGKRKV